ncbi:RidA family protein [Microbacterium luteum]|uniref:RidA family protein n=1 Tax=Microbacterium TaxID=33882 RepID=UPI001E4B7937|nr:RidA family protein [Microbacterium luteum]
MTRRAVNPATLLSPPGPYSQVVRSTDVAFVSGQVGAGIDGELVGPGIVEQTVQAVSNIGSALTAVGLELADVVKLTIFLAYADDLDDLVPYMDAAFPALFTKGLPASSLVFVNRLFDPSLRIEIEAIAHR